MQLRCRTVGLISKDPPKMRFKKFAKLTGYTQACNSLTIFEYESHAMTRNGNENKSTENWFKKTCEISSRKLIFGGFQPFGITVCRVSRLLRHFAALPCMYANTRRRQVAIKSEKKPFGNSNQLKCIQHLKRLGMQNQ